MKPHLCADNGFAFVLIKLDSKANFTALRVTVQFSHITPLLSIQLDFAQHLVNWLYNLRGILCFPLRNQYLVI